MIRLLPTLLISSLAFLTGTEAAEFYPSVPELEHQLILIPGGEVPREVLGNGGVFHVYYEGAKQLPDGRYQVMIKLRK
jgi:hypothetical protein